MTKYIAKWPRSSKLSDQFFRQWGKKWKNKSQRHIKMKRGEIWTPQHSPFCVHIAQCASNTKFIAKKSVTGKHSLYDIHPPWSSKYKWMQEFLHLYQGIKSYWWHMKRLSYLFISTLLTSKDITKIQQIKLSTLLLF